MKQYAKFSQEQFDALIEYINAVIDEDVKSPTDLEAAAHRITCLMKLEILLVDTNAE